jgi:hypothetical protein
LIFEHFEFIFIIGPWNYLSARSPYFTYNVGDDTYESRLNITQMYIYRANLICPCVEPMPNGHFRKGLKALPRARFVFKAQNIVLDKLLKQSGVYFRSVARAQESAHVGTAGVKKKPDAVSPPFPVLITPLMSYSWVLLLLLLLC